MLDKEEITAAYRFVLRRAPESNDVIKNWQDKGLNSTELTDALLSSHEFRSAYFSSLFPQRVIVFIHIPKTAGTALRENWLLKNITGEWFWFGMTGHVDFWEKMRAIPFLASTNSLIGGHKHIADFIDLNIVQPKTYLSVIREPVDRAISYFNFIKASKTHPLSASLEGKTLLEAVSGKDGFGKHICSNEQLAFLFDSNKTISNQDNIIIGKQEYVDDFLSISNKEISFESFYDEQGLKRENVGTPVYKKELADEEGYEEAIAFLTDKLAREIDFYNSFDRVLKLDAEQYELVRKKHIVNDLIKNNSQAAA